MVVTKMLEMGSSRYRIEIDYEFAFVLYKGEIRSLGIDCGQEIDEITYRKICSEILPKRAKMRCLKLLEKRSYTEKQLEDKLKDGLYSKECIAIALDYVKEYRYVDDEQYTNSFIEANAGKQSKRFIANKLREKGIAKDMIEEQWNIYSERHGQELDESAVIRDILSKKNWNPATMNPKEYQRMIQFLYRRGFSLDTIYEVSSSSHLT